MNTKKFSLTTCLTCGEKCSHKDDLLCVSCALLEEDDAFPEDDYEQDIALEQDTWDGGLVWDE